MKKQINILAVSVVALLGVLVACSKSNNDSPAINTTNLSGSYKLAGLVFTNGNISINVYDSLDACEKDDIIKLNSDMTANYIDAGITCVPPGDGNGNWSLSNDSLYIDGNGGKVKSFNGKTLVLVGHPSANGIVDVTTTSTTTLTKQ